MSIRQIYEDSDLHLQQTTYTCGPCALLNVLLMKGDTTFTEDELASICEAVPITGTDNKMMVSAARMVGLEVVAVTTGASPADIDRHLAAGQYVIVNYRLAFNGKGHFAMVAESDDKAFYLRDSSLGLLRLKRADLVKHWYNNDGSIKGWLLALE